MDTNWQQILPIYRADAVDARLAGFEGDMKVSLIPSLTLDVKAQYTHGSNRTDDIPLPMIPPFQVLLDTRWEHNTLMGGIEAECTAKQNRTDTFEKETAGYAIVQPYLQKTFFRGNIIHRFTISVDNLFNTEYRNHLSRIKSIMPETGRNITINYKCYF